MVLVCDFLVSHLVHLQLRNILIFVVTKIIFHNLKTRSVYNICVMFLTIGLEQSPTGVWYGSISSEFCFLFCFVSPTMTVGLWLRPQSSLARSLLSTNLFHAIF